ncbi:uncharacterized protein MONBRDRAFT_18115 [Monosiga brevicollis MX1]|uniref:Uncharacterized protein n=1 Tax=Monosiga brevicollis TaxID=81824 RepID=A9UU09_MONBE|nr:uncharacterized protein MONBRDRAFT_18115 [Monosiga brevicollis MX1]EDQ91339.1 predicted protein [Monosiga brevicollis MX1]|eukprot:XP_001743761.1 hypothetical protein [Monosiga brevicollis MX1]
MLTRGLGYRFDQTLDHFNPQDTRTFKQQYQVNRTFYKAGGPLFLMLGGEGPASPEWLETNTAIMLYAQQLNAVVAQIEHRFYGESQPFEDLSVDNLRYLSSEQALADAANFIQSFLEMNGMPADTRVVSFGGSYSGALSAFLRTKYPHVVYAAVATSSPVLAKLDYVEYHEVVGRSMGTSTHGQACVDQIKGALSKVDAMLADSSQWNQLAQDMKICSDTDLNVDLDKQTFLSNLIGNIDGIVQYNLDAKFQGRPTVQSMCDIMAPIEQDYDAFVALNAYLLNASDMECNDGSYQSFVTDLRNTSLSSDFAGGTRQWIYQTCMEFAYFQTTDASDQPFGVGVPLSYFEQQCVDGYGLPPVPNVNWTNEFYGGQQVAGTRIIYPNGSIDPWHALSVTSNTTIEDTLAIFINGTAHCANMYPPSSSDLPGLTAARTSILNTLQTWLHASS